MENNKNNTKEINKNQEGVIDIENKSNDDSEILIKGFLLYKWAFFIAGTLPMACLPLLRRQYPTYASYGSHLDLCNG